MEVLEEQFGFLLNRQPHLNQVNKKGGQKNGEKDKKQNVAKKNGA
jgi:hypothetical protein